MSSSSEDFFKDCEDNNQSFTSTTSSSLLPSSLTDLSSSLDENSTDHLLFESLAWDQNIIDLFNELPDDINTHNEHSTTNTTTPKERQEVLQATNVASNTVHDRSLDNALHASNVCLFEDAFSERITQKHNCLDAPGETYPENNVHFSSQPATAVASQDHENLNQIHMQETCMHSTHGGIETAHTYTEQRTEDLSCANQSNDDWNTHTKCSPVLLADSWKDSGFDEAKSTQDEVPLPANDSQLSERHRELQTKIIDVMHQIERCVTEGIPLPIRRKARWEECAIENGILQTIDPSQEGRTIRPLNTRRLQLMVQLLATIYQLLTTGTSCTKRELYYLHPDLAQTPAYTYATLDDVCALLDADTWELNVFNTSKGLLAGPLELTLSDGQRIDCNSRWGMAVPLDVGGVTAIRTTAKLVLVVEKDTVFKRLLEDGILHKFPDTFVLITAKGYPDVSTRLLLKKIATWTKVPIYALMDADPHGIEIFCVYKFGSLAMVHQQRSLAVPTMQWIGLLPSDIELLGLQGVPLRESELKRIEHMIKRPYVEGHIKRELLLLRQLAIKVEIESLYNIASDFITTVYLKGKLKQYICLEREG